MRIRQSHSRIGSLGVLGVSELGESIYRALLRHPALTPAELSGVLLVDETLLGSGIGELERLGLVTLAPGSPIRLHAAPPDIAVEALLNEQQARLQRARATIAELERERVQSADQRPVLEVIDSDLEAKRQPYSQSLERATTEVLCLVRPPFMVSAPGPRETTRTEARRRGVRFRNIVHPDTLQVPGWREVLKADIEDGEEVRLLPSIPFKMIITDRALGLLPLEAGNPTGPVLLLRRSAVLDALCGLFDSLWATAVPLGFRSDGSVSLGHAQSFSPQIDALVSLLASGVNDKAAAERLGISERTLMRRMELLYQQLNAKSRFQAGWMAALQASGAGGWSAAMPLGPRHDAGPS
ncbi:MAG: hypothetical protein DI603_06505 [Roseateles depolymerans]|uniref:HTH luxR-type domain-containing protein n=1 Tax=Roseateles depolymerans TaxID=76731 RepID=A0A2W5DZF9_9BURK|nr:MAG: hypothetical protein DI603_06505 [Roseateles depolymerans]